MPYLSRTFDPGDDVRCFVGIASHFGVCVNFERDRAGQRWQGDPKFRPADWWQLDVYLPFVFFGVRKWTDR